MTNRNEYKRFLSLLNFSNDITGYLRAINRDAPTNLKQYMAVNFRGTDSKTQKAAFHVLIYALNDTRQTSITHEDIFIAFNQALKKYLAATTKRKTALQAQIARCQQKIKELDAMQDDILLFTSQVNEAKEKI